MEWFHHADLSRHFERFVHTGIHAVRQIDLAVAELREPERPPLFLLVNLGETHHPYEYSPECMIPPAPFSRARLGSSIPTDTFTREQQVECARFLDAMMGDLLDTVDSVGRPTLVVICGDHGECFGEDEHWGHGFYHPKVMEVPMIIHFMNGLSEGIHPAGENSE
jgi:arylsulfatase A-like enzyme